MSESAQNTGDKQVMGFQTEVKQLLNLMIHSLYSNKEIFLRELISNASDACDKLRYVALTQSDLYQGDAELNVRVTFDTEARTITIRDNGIGMTHDEVIANLGTIARSGTREWMNNLSGDQSSDSQLIGQFGVGFYSAFIVADRVTVETRRAGVAANQAVRWESEGTGEFSIEAIERAERGTSITLHLREGEDDFLTMHRLRSIMQRYSDHIALPILMRKEVWNSEKGEYETKDEWETINQASALWTRGKNEITDEQYQSFYKHVAHDYELPLAWTHNRVEGRSEYTQLLYIPKRAPFDLWDRSQKRGLKLYVRRVFIMDNAEELLPSYLRWVRGVVDSTDLPLNVSREILQESRDVKAIREGCTKRVLGMLEDMAENKADDYKTFWREFGAVLKEGMGEDHGNQERIAKLLRLHSTAAENDETLISLADYVSRMKEGQKAIYYVTADTLAAAKSSPHLEVFRKKGVEVLLLTDRVDEWMLSFLENFDDKPLTSVARGALDLGELDDEAEKAEAQRVAEDAKDLIEKVKATLGEQVSEVRTTTRLTDSASCLVSQDGEVSGHLERILKQAGQAVPNRKPILELNPSHALVQRLKGESAHFDDLAVLLYEQAVLAEGGTLENPAAFVRRINALLV